MALNFFLIFMLLSSTCSYSISCKHGLELGPVQMARSEILHARNWAEQCLQKMKTDYQYSDLDSSYQSKEIALADCLMLYQNSEPRLAHILSGKDYGIDDAVAWLSATMASHRSCLDGLEEKGITTFEFYGAQNLTSLLEDALVSLKKQCSRRPIMLKRVPKRGRLDTIAGLLASWNATNSKANLVVAQDGSGNYKTINEAVSALANMSRPERTIIYVKAGVYHENVEVGNNLKNVMFVGDGMDKTIVTGNKNVVDGATTLSSATFGITGDGFWARDMTFENTAGPQKHQAVALRAASDLSIFYRCSFKGYQDTLFVHMLRQFYRNCHIYGTVDYIFGDAAVVFQNCDFFVRKPMEHQSNMITAQGRQNPNQNTGISIINCRVAPAPDLVAVEGRFKSYLGRPWKQYSRTVFMKTNVGGFIDPKGWKEWDGNFALSTLYYGEYMNTGSGASTGNRVKWPGFHLMHHEYEASPFSVTNFIQGNFWLPASGVPFMSDI